MSHIELAPTEARSGRFQGFQELMRFRVHNILLVSSLYDSFILSEDDKLHELFLDSFLQLNLHYTPGLRTVATAQETLELARQQNRYNLIVTSMRVGDMGALTLARKLREAGVDTPIVLLAFDNRELTRFVRKYDTADFEKIFLWQGDVRVLLAIVKYIEDKMNVAHDTGVVGVQAILVIEDNIRYYSSFLPMIYTELMKHSHSLIPEGLNLSHKLMRIRARPKILLCGSYEEAWRYFASYPAEIQGIISDIEFPRGGEVSSQAGLQFAEEVRRVRSDVPILLQSSLPKNEALAREVGASFLLKDSPLLLHELRKFMFEHFGFGDFAFRLPDGTEVGRAHDLATLVQMLLTVPAESLAYHGERNHFSSWLKARTEFALANRLRPRKVSDYATLEDLRKDPIDSIAEYRREQNRSMVADFDRTTFDTTSSFSRIGGGSIGGKARGLAFINVLLNQYELDRRFPGVNITVPPSVVVATDVFDRFLERDSLRDFAIGCSDCREIHRRFLRTSFPADVMEELAAFLDLMRYPLAVRSSGLLEDSQYQPFSGIYETYMLPNNHPDPAVRLQELVSAIKRVYASTFSEQAKAYHKSTPHRLEEEKMAVIAQKVVGSVHGERFYPDFAGVARSHNFYPSPPMTAGDGVAAVALGLGRTVSENRTCLRFCPKYPRHLVHFSSVEDIVRNSQTEFYAIELKDGLAALGSEDELTGLFGLKVAEADGTLAAVGSTYSPENDAVYDGLSRKGIRLVNFAPILKHGLFPLPEILRFLLDVGEEATQSPVELEFAVNLNVPRGAPKEFGFLQIRPLAISQEVEELELGEVEPSELICQSASVLGHGRIDDVRDLVVVDYHRFERPQSREVAVTVGRFNADLAARGVPYLLIGVGRWGSKEPLLGIPVTWDQIAGVRVIVEAGFRDFRVSPSQGTHFFQNLTSSNVGYFTVNPEAGEGFVDWDWLAEQQAVSERDCVRHLRFEEPLTVKMDGKRHRGVIFKPGRD